MCLFRQTRLVFRSTGLYDCKVNTVYNDTNVFKVFPSRSQHHLSFVTKFPCKIFQQNQITKHYGGTYWEMDGRARVILYVDIILMNKRKRLMNCIRTFPRIYSYPNVQDLHFAL